MWWRKNLVRARNSARIDEEGTPREPYQFYIDTRTYGGVPHGGFGLGVDRVCSWLSGAEHIRSNSIPKRFKKSNSLSGNMADIIALGCGLVGNFVVTKLTQLGLNVHVVDLTVPQDVKSNPSVTYQEGDIFQL